MFGGRMKTLATGGAPTPQVGVRATSVVAGSQGCICVCWRAVRYGDGYGDDSGFRYGYMPYLLRALAVAIGL